MLNFLFYFLANFGIRSHRLIQLKFTMPSAMFVLAMALFPSSH